MEFLIPTILFGMVGGLVRALVGLTKFYSKNKQDEKLRVWYLAFSLFVAAIVGAFAAALTEGDWRVALIAGYAGTDFFEGLYKIKRRQGLEI